MTSTCSSPSRTLGTVKPLAQEPMETESSIQVDAKDLAALIRTFNKVCLQPCFPAESSEFSAEKEASADSFEFSAEKEASADSFDSAGPPCTYVPANESHEGPNIRPSPNQEIHSRKPQKLFGTGLRLFWNGTPSNTAGD